VAIIKPDAYGQSRKDVLRDISQLGFRIVEVSERALTRSEATLFYAEHKRRPFFNELVDFMSSGDSAAMILEKEDGIQAWREAMGPTDPDVARKEAPRSLRALYGADKTRNALHGSDSRESSMREIGLLFSHRLGGWQMPKAKNKEDAAALEMQVKGLKDLPKDEPFNRIVREAAASGEDIETVVNRVHDEYRKANPWSGPELGDSPLSEAHMPPGVGALLPPSMEPRMTADHSEL